MSSNSSLSCWPPRPCAAAAPLAQPETAPTATVPAASAEAGKDVVHQLNSAFTKVFEIVAPSVVIIEVTKKNDPGENPTLEDLFFQGPQDENAPRRNPRNSQPVQSEGSGFIVRADGYIYTNYHVLEGRRPHRCEAQGWPRVSGENRGHR